MQLVLFSDLDVFQLVQNAVALPQFFLFYIAQSVGCHMTSRDRKDGLINNLGVRSVCTVGANSVAVVFVVVQEIS